jgi:thiamine biosynthesis lipoprotein
MLLLADGPGALRRFILPALFVLALFAAQFLRSGAEEEQGLLTHRFTGPTMGTNYTVQVVASSLTAAQQAAIADAITERLESVNAEMSTYRADSALSQLNVGRSTQATAISADLATVLAEAERIHGESRGAFDVTVGPLVNAWGFGPDGPTQAPSDTEIAALRTRVGQAHLRLDAAAKTITKAHPAVYIDLSAIAKGYAVDRVAGALDALDHRDYYVDVGGEARVRGHNAEERPWRVGIEKPDAGRGQAQEILRLTDMSVATSGDYRNYYARDGVRISHTIDPRTGRPISHGLASVTVLHAACMTADAWATALNVLGPVEGLALAEAKALPAMFIVRQQGGGFEVETTTAFGGFTRRP